jgi:hypothetical protein
LWRDTGQFQLAKERNQVIVHGPDVVHVGIGADATLNLNFEHADTFMCQRIKAHGLLRQALFFSKSRSVIDFASHSLCPIKLSLPSADTTPLAIEQFVADLPNLARWPEIQNHFTITHVVSGFFSSSYVETADKWLWIKQPSLLLQLVR